MKWFQNLDSLYLACEVMKSELPECLIEIPVGVACGNGVREGFKAPLPEIFASGERVEFPRLSKCHSIFPCTDISEDQESEVVGEVEAEAVSLGLPKGWTPDNGIPLVSFVRFDRLVEDKTIRRRNSVQCVFI